MPAISEHRIHAVVSGLDGELRATEAQVTLDSGWAPYVQGTLVCPAESTAQLRAIDPRGNVRVAITIERHLGRVDTLADLTRKYGGGRVSPVSAEYPAAVKVKTLTDDAYHAWSGDHVAYTPPQTRLLKLGLRRRRIDPASGRVTLTVASDEALLQDEKSLAPEPVIPSDDSPTLTALIHNALFPRFGYGLSSFTPAATSVPVNPQTDRWQPGQSLYDYLAGTAKKAGYRLWCDELGAWRLHSEQWTKPYQGQLSATENATEGSDDIDRDGDWYNAVVVIWNWTDIFGGFHTATDVARTNATFRRTKTIIHDGRPYVGPGEARRTLESALRRGRVIEASAINDYDFEPGVTATISYPSTPPTQGRVTSVSWRFPDDEMQVKTTDLADTDLPPIIQFYTPVEA